MENKRFAAIDIGSNAIRLLIAECNSHGFDTLHEERVPVRLGHRAFTEGHLDGETFQAAMATLANFRETMDRFGVLPYRAVATSAVRDSDPKRFCIAADSIGIKVDVIDGQEEARLVHRALRDRIPMGNEPWLIADLGGGSLELLLADRDHIHWSESKPIGTVRLLETMEHDQAAIHQQVKSYEMLRQQWDVDGLAVTGGNATSIAKILGAPTKENPASIGFAELQCLRQDLENMASHERMEEFGIREDRADVIAQAAHVYEWIAAKAGVERIHVPGWGLREGVLLDLMDAYFSPDNRAKDMERALTDACINLGRSNQYDEAHGAQVTQYATQLFDTLQVKHKLGAIERRILYAAAQLHDIGKSIDNKGHHKHSAYIIKHNLLPGFTRADQILAAAIARYHRKSLPRERHGLYASLGRSGRDKLHALGPILRLADALDCRHNGALSEVQFALEEEFLVIRANGDAMRPEKAAVARRSAWFTQNYGVPVRLTRPKEVLV